MENKAYESPIISIIIIEDDIITVSGVGNFGDVPESEGRDPYEMV